MPNKINIADLLNRTERNTVLYINYDNEAFMNTGIQESGSTPYSAHTTTSAAMKSIKGKVGIKQDILTGFSFVGMKSAFLATANPAYVQDFIGKVVEAMKTPGGGFIQIFSPCPLGWKHAGEDSLKIAKLATDSGYWPLNTVRVTDGVPKMSYSRPIKIDRGKIEELIKSQGKFRHLLKPQFLEDNMNEIIGQAEARVTNLNNLLRSIGAEDPLDIYLAKLDQIPPQNHLAPGHGLCPGCGAGMVLNILATAAHYVAGDNIVYVNNTSCSEVATSKNNQTSWIASWAHQLFESGATVADAFATTYRILKAKGLADTEEVPYVIHIAGDGSTYDIGYQFLKSALIRSSSYQIMHPNLEI
jgi:pyruvate/2-oxoacid:ferredoxin oxidoreductase beta subunit